MTVASPILLAFDASGPFCSVALWADGRVVSEAHAEMARGQAEMIMPMIADLLAEAQIDKGALSGIAIGVGPGNFTGLRIAVATGRGLALGLGLPAIGVTAFDVLYCAAGSPPGTCLMSLPAPRDQVYLHLAGPAAPRGSGWLASADAPGAVADRVIGAQAKTLARAMGRARAEAIALPRPAPVIAQIAADRWPWPQDLTAKRPAPLYIRPPDAAPPSGPRPVHLP